MSQERPQDRGVGAAALGREEPQLVDRNGADEGAQHGVGIGVHTCIDGTHDPSIREDLLAAGAAGRVVEWWWVRPLTRGSVQVYAGSIDVLCLEHLDMNPWVDRESTRKENRDEKMCSSTATVTVRRSDRRGPAGRAGVAPAGRGGWRLEPARAADRSDGAGARLRAV